MQWANVTDGRDRWTPNRYTDPAPQSAMWQSVQMILHLDISPTTVLTAESQM